MAHSLAIVHPAQLSFDILARWRAALAAEPQWASPFLTPEFAMAVGAGRDDARIIIARDKNGLLGLLPVHKCAGGYARPLGAPVADHQAFITEAGFALPIEQVLQAAGFSALRFSGLNDPRGQLASCVRRTQCVHLADLADGPDAYFAAREKACHRHFKKMRQRARGAIRDYGTMTLKLNNHEQAMFDLLLHWKRQQYRRTRKCDVLAAHWISTVLRRLWQSHGRVRAILNVLELGGTPAAAEIGLVCQGTYHSWIAAYDPALSRCSPGLLLLEGVLRRADDLGITMVDLGAGHDHYKKYYANAALALSEARVLGQGLAAQQQRFMESFGARLAGGLPLRVADSLDFIAACHPRWPDRLRGIAGRLGHALA